MYTVHDKQQYWRSRKLYRVLKDDRVSSFCYYTSIFHFVYKKVSPLFLCYMILWHVKNLFRFQIKPDDIKAKLDNRKARKNQEYSQYLADNNLQDTYAPTNGKTLLLKCVVVISITNLFLLITGIYNQKICIFIPYSRNIFIYNLSISSSVFNIKTSRFQG